MKASVFVLSVMAALTLISFSSSCAKAVMEITGGNPLREDEVEPWDPPHKPETFDVLFDRSDLITFAEVVQVVDEKRRIGEPPPEGIEGIWPWFHRQAGSIKLLRILKGPQEFTSKTINIIKGKSDFYLEVGRRRVFYLRRDDEGQYRTVDVRPFTFTLPWTLSAINNMKLEGGELSRGGTVVSVSSEALPLEERKIHVFRGFKTEDQEWETYFIKTLKTDEWGIAEVELPDGHYAFRLELEDNLYSRSTIVENNWRTIFFRLDRIRDKKEAQ